MRSLNLVWIAAASSIPMLCILSLLSRAALRSTRFVGPTARAAIPILATVHQPFSSHAALPALVAPIGASQEPNLHSWLQLIAAGSVLGVLSQSYEPADCGKRKTKDSDVADDMCEVDQIEARQYLGRPASSAGVERMFSKAGKLYRDGKKGQEDESLEAAALFAAANTE